MTKKNFIFGLLLLIQSSLSAQEFHNGIAAKVNGSVITTFDIFKLTGAREAQVHQKVTDKEEAFNIILKMRSQALKQLIENQLILDEFKQLGATVPAQLIDTQLEGLIAKEAKGDRTVFLEKIDEMGYTLDEYREKIEDNVAIEMMISENVGRKAEVTDEKVANYYAQNPQEFTNPLKLHLKVLMVNSDDMNDEKNKTLQSAIDKKESFADLAKKADYSQDMGMLDSKDIRQEFVQHCTNLTEGSFSKPLSLEERNYYFQVVKKEGGDPRLFTSQLQKQLKSYLLRKEERRLYEAYVTKLRNNANVEDLTKK